MDICYKPDHLQENLGIVHLKRCPPGKQCNGKLNRCMSDPYNMYEGKLPGQHCEYSYQCASGSCRQSTCAGNPETAQCATDLDCSAGLYCDSSRCRRVKLSGAECARDEECPNNMACANKKCTPYGTLGDSEVSDNPMACKSGFTREATLSGEKTVSVCSATPRIVNKEGPEYRCAGPSDSCLYSSGDSFTFETPCACGLTPTGASFCPHIYTDTYTTLALQVTSKFGGHCHTKDRFNLYDCLTSPLARENIESEEDLALLNKFIVQHFERE
jgi:hypothetical protein